MKRFLLTLVAAVFACGVTLAVAQDKPAPGGAAKPADKPAAAAAAPAMDKTVEGTLKGTKDAAGKFTKWELEVSATEKWTVKADEKMAADLAKLDGKKVKLTGKEDAAKKEFTVSKFEEAKAAAEAPKKEEHPAGK